MDYVIKPIDTQRLKLRPIELKDAEDMFDYASQGEFLKYVPFKPHESLEETKKVIEEVFLTKKDKRMPETWAIVLKENGKMIGTIDFNHLNKRTNEADVGYVLHQDYYNQGLMTEALKAVIEFGFRFFGLNKIYARCHPLNFASSKVMAKAGMEFEEAESDAYGQIEKLVYAIENKKRR